MKIFKDISIKKDKLYCIYFPEIKALSWLIVILIQLFHLKNFYQGFPWAEMLTSAGQ
jgi:hypothetical protein